MMNKIEDTQLSKIAHISRDEIFEPYAFDQSLENIRSTATSINEKIEYAKKKSIRLKDKLLQFTDKALNSSTKAVRIKESLSALYQNNRIKPKQNQEQEKEAIELTQSTNHEIESYAIKGRKGNKLLTELKQKAFNIDFEELKNKGKIGAQNLTDKIKELSLKYIQNGIALLVSQNGEDWIVGVSRDLLKRQDIFNYEDVRAFSEEERLVLLEELYPYSNSWLKEHSSKFDYTVNIVLGAIVFTNIPFTGVIVGLVNMAKTIIKIANRLYILSNIYGLPILSSESLYKASALIIKSMNDWECSQQHQPLKAEVVIEQLYNEQHDENFVDLMKETLLKDSYISIPFVGMVSLKKINADDFKSDIMILHLFKNYFFKQQLIEQLGQTEYDQINTSFHQIYETIIADQSMAEIQKEITKKNAPKDTKMKLFSYLKTDKNSNSEMLIALQEEALKRYHNQTTKA